MSTETREDIPSAATAASPGPLRRALRHELQRLRADWWWLLLLGILVSTCGLLALTYPFITSLAAVVVLGVSLIFSGTATIVTAFWAGEWGGRLLQVLVGILYVMTGVVIMDAPVESTALLTLFLAAFFIVLGIFRVVAALLLKFPQWGWAMLNGLLTLLAGLVIYKHFPASALWVIGFLVGIELLFSGWTWIMLSLAIRRLPAGDE